MTRRLKSLALAGALLAPLLLNGCAPLLIGGAMVGTGLMVTDRRTSGTQIDDQAIELRGASRAREIFADRGHANITSYNRQVLLTGEVPTEADKAALEDAVARIENVRTTVNELFGRPTQLGVIPVQ